MKSGGFCPGLSSLVNKLTSKAKKNFPQLSKISAKIKVNFRFYQMCKKKSELFITIVS